MSEPQELRHKLTTAAPMLTQEIDGLATQWTDPIVERLDDKKGTGFPKTFNDPIWGVIEFLPWETAILDGPVLQRLRGVKQLGMAHTVYPGAVHDRLEHSRGVVEAAERMVRSLERNAEHHRRFGRDADQDVPQPSELDRVSVRLGALLHDIGHGPFSHATENLIRIRLEDEFVRAEDVLRAEFQGVTRIATAETIAVLVVLSEPMRRVMEHGKLEAVSEPTRLAPAVAARILGSRSYLAAGYLSGIVSGPVDADKLDYMARDSHHSGLPLGLDLSRLISKLEVVTVTPQNAPNPELRKRAEESPAKRFYELGISLAGLGAYEQLVIGRVILYDRIYYHHKVRAAEAMVRRLISLAEMETREPFAVSELFAGMSDDSMLDIWSKHMESVHVRSGGPGASALGQAIRCRGVYYRAFAFASRFIVGIDNLPKNEQADTRAMLWAPCLDALSDSGVSDGLAREVFLIAKQIGEAVAELEGKASKLQPEHVLIDLPHSRAVAATGDILTRTETGQVGVPNLFFDPERWSSAYEQQKQCGFVFAPSEFVPLVATASRIVFYDRFRLVMGDLADRASKTPGVVRPEWIEAAAERGICSAECLAALKRDTPVLVPVRSEDIQLPTDWAAADAGLAQRLSEAFAIDLPGGLPASAHKSVMDALCHLLWFADMVRKGGDFANRASLPESDLQSKLRSHLRSRGLAVLEGAEYGGGETDLMLPGNVIVENKVTHGTESPFDTGPNYVWQARRYSLAVCSHVVYVMLAYKPLDEAAILPLTECVRVMTPGSDHENVIQVRVVIPWGYPVPSRAKAPVPITEVDLA